MQVTADRFTLVAQELSEQLLRYLRRLVNNPAIADDLLQETLIRMERALPAFLGESSTKTWAFTIASRVVADHFRAPEARLAIIELDESVGVAAGGAAVDEQLVVDEMNACVRRVIDGLPEDYRTALVLHDLERLTAAEVAEICGCSLATAKIRIHRARSRLRDALNEACDFYNDAEGVLRCDRSAPSETAAQPGGRE